MTQTTSSGPIRFPFPDAPEPGQAVEIAEGVLWIRIPLPWVLDHVNVYAFDDGDGWTIVDTGIDTRKIRGVWDALLAGPLAFRPVRRVLLTHHHVDHTGLAGWFQDQGAQLLTSRTSWLMARMLLLDVQEAPPPETVRFWKAAGMDEARIAQRLAERPMNTADKSAPMPLGYLRLQEGERLRMGGRDWQIRIGHGHAPEHVTLWEEGGPLVIGGDQILPGISANIGIYATEPEADPITEWMAANDRFLPHAREDHLVLPGHKLPFTGLPTRLRQMTENHHGALKRLRRHLAEPRTACDCFVPLFGREITGDQFGLAMAESVAHLNHLWKAGEISRTLDENGVWQWQML